MGNGICKKMTANHQQIHTRLDVFEYGKSMYLGWRGSILVVINYFIDEQAGVDIFAKG